MKLSKNARILTADGQDIGNLNRFVLDPHTKEVTHIVFEHGLLPKKEYVLPMDLIDQVDEQGVHLRSLPVNSPNELPPFTEKEFIITDERQLDNEGAISADAVPSYYYYPSAPFGSAGMIRPMEGYVNTSSRFFPVGMTGNIPVSGQNEQGVVRETTENIPDDTVALKEGAKVLSSDSENLGSVEKLYVDPQVGRVTHLLLAKGLLNKERKLIPAGWIDNADEDNVFLSVDRAFVDRLPPYEEK